MCTFRRGRVGHLGVNLTQAGVYRMHSVHRLIAAAWIGPAGAGQVVMHLDDDPINNSVSNLRYGTSAENSAQMVDRARQAVGLRHGLHRLDPDAVRDIRRRSSEGAARLAREYGVAINTVCDVLNGRTWKQVA